MNGAAASIAPVAEAGIEPADVFDLTGNLACGCVLRQECRAARALRNGRVDSLDLSPLDADLHADVAAWEGLPAAIRNTVSSFGSIARI